MIQMVEIERLIAQVQQTFPNYDATILERAYEFAAAAHKEQKRRTGEPYVAHCLATASILADLRIDPPVIVAGLLHDTVEDTSITLEQIQTEFGNEVASLVDGVTKLSQINQLTGHRDRQLGGQEAENLRKMFLAMAEDVRVVLIKLADRLHNMRTLHGHKREKQLRIARETLDIYAPLANRLGIWQIKWELEDLCLRYLEPEIYEELANKLAERRHDREAYLDKVVADLRQALVQEEIEAEVSGRPKHLYSIYKKMLRKSRDFEQIYDVRAVRVIVPSVRDCYAALGIVHSLWRPLPGEFDDYIANPKENNYQSLHTAVVGPEGKSLEIQIRTREMHYYAEYGVAAHWRYKEQLRRDRFLEEKIKWLRALLDWRQDMGGEDAEEFIESVKTDVLPERVLVFTPKGDILELPAGSTPVDFAYHIHTEVGHRCRGAKVNGQMVPLHYALQDGDQVEIIAAKRGGPSRDWLNPHLGYARTSRARGKIRSWFRHQDREVNITQGRELLERELKKLGLVNESYERLCKLTRYEKIDDFLAAIGAGDLSAQTVAARALELHRQQEAAEELEAELTENPPDQSLGVTEISSTIKGVGGVLTRVAACCNPLPGDEIIGYITRGHGITIHRRDCPNILNKNDGERLIAVDWGNGDHKTSYPVMIKVRAFDRGGLLRDIVDIVAKEDVNMRAANAVTNKKDHSALITATLEIADAAQLSRILTRISRLPNVLEAYRQTS
ncbi:MAG: GTP diphosphokinase [Ardenticatenaceae bacterium]|nr:GTP diphosphokinase [Ardenticatenaceae bacterium]